jgi:DNA-binding NarL/FixJ family response regulator
VIRVALAAPALAVRLGLRTLLAADKSVEVVAEAATLAELIPLPTEAKGLAAEADMLVVAMDSPPASLLEKAHLPVLLLFSGDPPDLADLPLTRPWGLLPLESSAEELLAAINALHEGLFVSPPALLRRLLSSDISDSRPLAAQMEDSPGGELTERESEVLALLAQGLANKQIAARLGISEHTIKFHVSSIYSKLGASSRTEAVRLGVRQGRIVL